MKLSIIILTKNEGTKLAKLLPSLDFADEIIVIDDYSTDQTIKIVQSFKGHAYQHALNNDFAQQRNFGLENAQGEWVWFIDADEMISPNLRDEVLKLINNKPKFIGYQIRRIDKFEGKLLTRGEVKDIWLTRLGRREAGLWQRPVHEFWQINPCGRLSNTLIHEAHTSWHSFIQKVKIYARIEANYRFNQGKHWSLGEMIAFPIGKWLNNLVIKGGVLDGLPGWKYAAAMSYHSYLVRVELYMLWYGNHQVKNLLAKWWRRLFWLWFGCLVLGQLTRIQLNGKVAIYGFEILMGLMIGLVGMRLGQRRRGKWPPFSKYFLWVTGTFAISLAVNLPILHQAAIGASLYLWRWILYLGFWWSLYQARQWRWLTIPYREILYLIGLGWAGLALIQYILLPDMRWLFVYGWDNHYFRAIGTILDPGFLGILLVLTLILLEAKVKKSKLAYCLLMAALALTYARSAYLAYGLSMVLFAWTKKSWRFLGLRLMILAVLLVLLPRPGGEGVRLERTYSVTQRLDSNLGAMELFKRHPLFGIGFNAYRTYVQTVPHRFGVTFPVHPSAPDNSWLLVLATSGIIGFGMWIGANGQLIYYFKKDPAVWISLITILTHSLTNNTYFYTFVMIWLGMLVADYSR